MPLKQFLSLLTLIHPITSTLLHHPRDGDPHTSVLYLTSNTYSDDILSGPSNTPQLSEAFVSDTSRPFNVPVDTTAFPSTVPSSLSFKAPSPVGPGLQSLPSSLLSSGTGAATTSADTSGTSFVGTTGTASGVAASTSSSSSGTSSTVSSSSIAGSTTSAIAPMPSNGGQGGGVKGFGAMVVGAIVGGMIVV